MDKEDVVCIYTYIYTYIHISHKNNDILPFATTWFGLEGIMLSEISQRKRNTILYHLYVRSKKQNKLTTITKQKQTHRYSEHTGGF